MWLICSIKTRPAVFGTVRYPVIVHVVMSHPKRKRAEHSWALAEIVAPAAARGAGWFCPINSHGFVCAGRLGYAIALSILACAIISLFSLAMLKDYTNKDTSEEYDAHLRPFIRPGRGNKTEKGNPGQWAARLIAIILVAAPFAAAIVTANL